MEDPLYIHFPLSTGEQALLCLPAKMGKGDVNRLLDMINAFYPLEES